MVSRSRSALVLGGGGPVGVAWEAGIAIGLAEAGIDLRGADRIVGTSAGSVVGSRLAAGHVLVGEPSGFALALPVPEGGFDREAIALAFGLWNAARAPEDMDPGRRRQIGAAALRARTASEEVWVGAIATVAGVSTWPDADLRIAAIEVSSGERRLLSRSSGVPIERALAASCCVPAMFPPVVIGSARFMDGGVGSGTNADVLLAEGFDRVLIVAPMCDRTIAAGTCAERFVEREAAALRAEGCRVAVVLPDEADARAFGAELMNPTRTAAALERGIERGRELASGAGGVDREHWEGWAR
jgi:NTE family protein